MKISAVKGTRDFYPEDWAIQRHIFDAWRTASRLHGFVEFEGPTLEQLDLYVRKSGEEIVAQLFNLEDRAGRRLALRPELTPTVARMVAARVNALPRPIKWFSIPRLYRGERPQRGRLREFFQWNIDVIGIEDIIADAECVAVAIESLRRLGLTAEDVVVRISDRRLIAALFRAAGMPDEEHAGAYAILDKAADWPAEALDEKWSAGPGRWLAYERLAELLAAESIDDVAGRAGELLEADGGALRAALDDDKRLLYQLGAFGLADFCIFDLRVVRGLAYYTGPVFEAYDRGGKERAIFGGGRYDHLLASVGGGSVPAVGFGMGDVVLALMLADRGLLPDPAARIDAFVVDADGQCESHVLALCADLRRAGVSADFDYKRRNMSKQMSAAATRHAICAVILRSESVSAGRVTIKHLPSGQQRDDVSLSTLTTQPIDQWLT
jgi:histidyl-tRNA synthetase